MKKRMLSFLTLGVSFTLLAGALIGANAKRVYQVGQVDDNGGIVVETNVDTTNLVKRMPFITPSDPYYTGASQADDPLYDTGKKYYQNVSMDNLGDIESVWDYYTGKGSLIAVIDSGIEQSHEEFYRDNECVISDRSAYFETNEQSGNVTMKDVATYGWSVVEHEIESGYDPDYGYYKEWVDHGSNVSSTAAAPMNSKGIVGIAPGANILALKIDWSDPSINAAIKYAADCGADVINMSLGGYAEGDYDPDTDPMQEAVNYAYNKGCIIVAAAGNEKTDEKSYPACFKHVISVGALADYSDKFDYSYSNYNKSSETSYKEGLTVDICAPGSVVAAGIEDPNNTNAKKLGYHYTSGTSFSSPIVAGAAAVWKEKHPNGTQKEFEEDLFASAYKAEDYSFRYYGNGNLNMYGLLNIEGEGISLDAKKIDLDTNDTTTTLTATSKQGTIASWTSSNTNVVTISGATGVASATATITVVGAGKSTITVTNTEGNTATCEVNVAQYVEVTGISVSDSVEVNETKTVKLNASVLPANATKKTINYISNNTSVATVDQKGTVKGIKAGTTTLTLTAENVTKTVNVTVNELTEQEHTVVFKTNNNDGNREVSNISNEVESGGDIIASSSCSKVYPGKNGIKLSSRDSNGSIDITLTDSLNITSITVNACAYVSQQSGNVDASSLTINGKQTSKLSSSLTDYTLEFEGTSTKTITIQATKRCYIKFITIVEGKSTQQKTLESISLNTTNAKTSFYVGESFTSEGLVVTAKYSDNSTKEVTGYSVSRPDLSSTGTKQVSVNYAENGVTKSATYNVTVSERPAEKTLSGITVDTTGAKTEFQVGDTFSYAGIKVTATYSDGSSKQITSNYLVSLPDMDSVGAKTVTVSYTEGGVTKTTTYTINVSEKTTPVEPEPEQPKANACGGSIVTTSAILSITALIGAGLIVIRKKEEK